MDWLRRIKKAVPVILVLSGSFMIAYGWGSYHFNVHDRWYIAKLWLFGVGMAVIFFVGKKISQKTTRRYQANWFWRDIADQKMEQMFFISALAFGIFLFRRELPSLIYMACWGALFFGFSRSLIQRHPQARPWLAAHGQWFWLGAFIFLLEAIWQYTAYRLYILDVNIRFFNIVLFRAIAMTVFWLGLAAGLHLISSLFKNILRHLGLGAWFVIFIFYSLVWTVNIAILYYSGLYISPIALQHAEGAGSVAINRLSFFLIATFIVAAIIIFSILRRWVKERSKATDLWHRRYGYVAFTAALLVIFFLTSFLNTPERVIARSFYDHYFVKKSPVTLDPAVQKKLEKFGLFYNQEQFYVNEREWVFTPTSTLLLPARFIKQKPNILIVFLESFSARLTGVYNPAMKDVTPHFNAFAADPQVTVFKKYFNASTPTITGTLAQLCSFLPPTGHNEIQNERKLQHHFLLCLPEILKQRAGFQSATYVTAVDKTYANKDGIFASMGVDEVLGTKELAKKISGEPLSWGYSDHQLFPAMFNIMQTAKQPFLMMLATVDTHPPYNLPKDAVNFKDGSQPVLNMVYTTDDAFGKFWNDFKQSPFAKNTMVVALADHAIFPTALTKDIFPDEAGKLTYYDENFLAMYIPDSVLPKIIDRYASGLDITPTILQLFDLNFPNSFEGYSIFSDRERFPNLLGMHELGLYINQVDQKGKRQVDYNLPTEIACDASGVVSATPDLTLCDYLNFYSWKRQMFEQGRFWKKT